MWIMKNMKIGFGKFLVHDMAYIQRKIRHCKTQRVVINSMNNQISGAKLLNFIRADLKPQKKHILNNTPINELF